jgi:hypothetical protein
MNTQRPIQRWLLACAAFAFALTPLAAASPPHGQALAAASQEHYLIITADLFLDHLSPYISLKESQGYSVTVKALSEIGYTADAIKSFVQYLYDGPNPPAYLFFVGDDRFIPTWPMTTDVLARTDYYYADLDGLPGNLPDLLYGRLPVRNTQELDDWIAKMEAYSQVDGNEPWIKSASFIATDSDTLVGSKQAAEFTEAVHDYVISQYTLPNGFSGNFPNNPQPGGDMLYPVKYGANHDHVVNSLNSGRSLVVYNGLGSNTAWLGPLFDQEDVRAMTGPPIPLALGLASDTVDFNASDSLARTWVTQADSGALAYIGSSADTYFEQDGELEKRFFLKLFENPADPASLGEALQYALERVGARYPQNALHYLEAYQIFGDPSLQMVLGPKPPDYSLTASPERLSLCGDGQAQTSLQVMAFYGFDSPVTLTAVNMPPGMSAVIQPNPIRPGETAALTITTTGLDLGSYPVTIQGDANGLIRQFELLVSVDGLAPAAPTLLDPPPLARSTSLRPNFTWEASPAAVSYEIEIASDHLFQSIFLSETDLSEPIYTPPIEFPPGSTFWWRVRGVNHCGLGAYSLPGRFTTRAAEFTCPDGTPQVIYATDFESDPGGWSAAGSNNIWALTVSDSFSPVWSYFASSEVVLPGEQRLVSPAILLPGLNQAPIELSFWSRHSFENTTECKDGGLLEISADDGINWQVISEESLLSIPYDGVISSAHQNPLGGLRAWCGQREWSHFTVRLEEYHGQEIRLGWLMGTDDSTPEGEGWYIDDVVVQSCRYPPPPGVTLEPASAHQTGIPGQTLTYALQATNTGPQPADFEVTAQGGQWATVVDPVLLSLDPGQSDQVIVTVSIPEDAAPGAVDRSEVTALYALDHAVNARAVLETRVILYRLSLSSPQTEKRGWPGQSVAFSALVTNTGNVPDSVDLSLDLPGGWTAAPLTSPLELFPGESREIFATVFIPPGAADGASETLTLEAASRGNPAVSARLELRVIVAYPRLYLPLVMGP